MCAESADPAHLAGCPQWAGSRPLSGTRTSSGRPRSSGHCSRHQSTTPGQLSSQLG